MATIETGIDSLHVCLTGATDVGGAQGDHDEALGGKRAAGRTKILECHRTTNTIHGISIVYVAAKNGTGLGILTAVTADSLAWTPPGGTQGTAVSISNGATVMLNGGTTSDKYIIVQRTDSIDLGGAEVVQLVDVRNNVVGGSNFTTAETAAGETKYRGLIFYVPTTNITDVRVWIDSTYNTNIQLAKEATVAGAIQTIANETTQPSGLSWSAPTTEGTAIQIGALNAGESYGLWIEQYVGVGESADPDVLSVLQISFDIGGTAYSQTLRGMCAYAEDLDDYAYFIFQDGAAIDLTGTPDGTFDSLPHGPVSLTANHTYEVVVVGQNDYDLRTLVYQDKFAFDIAADASETPQPPNGPDQVQIEAAADGEVLISAVYMPIQEGTTQAAITAKRATHWAVWITSDNTTPDTTTTPSYFVKMNMDGAPESLTYTTSGAYLQDTPIKATVRTYRDSVDYDSTNTDVVSTTADWWGPARPTGAVSVGKQWSEHQAPVSLGPGEVTWISQANNIYWKMFDGRTELWADTVLVWCLWYDSLGIGRCEFATPFNFKGNTISTTGTTEAVDVISWTAGDKRLGVNVAGTRVMVIDVTNTRLEFKAWDKVTAVSTTTAPQPVECKYQDTAFQVYDYATESYSTPICLHNDGIMYADVGLRKYGTQAECIP